MLQNTELQLPTQDTLFCDLKLSRKERFFPLGFPVDLETNSSEVMDAAWSSWAKFKHESGETPVRLCIGVTAASGEGAPRTPSCFARENLLSIVSDANNFVTCDLDRGFAYGWLTEEGVADRVFFRYYFLEAAAMTVLTQAHLAPVHGALVKADGRGLLLCGESCAGKSTLAYACARAGFTFLSDDGVYLARNRPGRFGVGNPHTIRLREDAPALFPELARFRPAMRANGKFSIEAATCEMRGIATAPGCDIDHIVFLNRHGHGQAKLRLHSTEQAFEWLRRYSVYGSQATRMEQQDTYARLVSAGVWELEYRDLGDAVSRLQSLARHGS